MPGPTSTEAGYAPDLICDWRIRHSIIPEIRRDRCARLQSQTLGLSPTPRVRRVRGQRSSRGRVRLWVPFLRCKLILKVARTQAQQHLGEVLVR
jgi:hypothetical protein